VGGRRVCLRTSCLPWTEIREKVLFVETLANACGGKVSTPRGDESKSSSHGHGWQAVYLQGPWMRPGFQAEMVT
jgi:hypothetical protein